LVSDVEFQRRKICFEEPKKVGLLSEAMPFDGVPFVIKSTVILECQYGRDQHAARKRKNARGGSEGVCVHF